jgi:hypothetical protein
VAGEPRDMCVVVTLQKHSDALSSYSTLATARLDVRVVDEGEFGRPASTGPYQVVVPEEDVAKGRELLGHEVA